LGRQQSCQWGGAHWLAYAKHNNTTSSPLPYFRKEFTVKPGLKKAICSVTARGVFEASLDGAKIGNDFLAPGWTDFRIHVPFVSHEISDRLSAGKHALGVILGDGWCCGNLTVLRRRNFYHDHPEFLLSLQLFYEDGSVEYVVSDASWQVKTGALLSGDIYDGEFYDARYEMPGWDTVGFDASSWDPAQIAAKRGILRNWFRKQLRVSG
jgi:alpha-L-rhamnosidase